MSDAVPTASDKTPGEVTEWSNVLDWKSSERETVPGVRIPPSPPVFAKQSADEDCLAEARRA